VYSKNMPEIIDDTHSEATAFSRHVESEQIQRNIDEYGPDIVIWELWEEVRETLTQVLTTMSPRAIRGLQRHVQRAKEDTWAVHEWDWNNTQLVTNNQYTLDLLPEDFRTRVIKAMLKSPQETQADFVENFDVIGTPITHVVLKHPDNSIETIYRNPLLKKRKIKC
jgi:hypothetical protein